MGTTVVRVCSDRYHSSVKDHRAAIGVRPGWILGAVESVGASFCNDESYLKRRLNLQVLSTAAVLMAAVAKKRYLHETGEDDDFSSEW